MSDLAFEKMDIDMKTQTDDEIREQLGHLRKSEGVKNSLIDELLRRLDELQESHSQLEFDYERERQFNRDRQRIESRLKNELHQYKLMVARNPFILVLIDGDGMIFNDRFLQNGVAGGKEAGNLLWAATRNYIHQTISDLSSDFKIVARVYANLKGLGDACHKAAILDSSFSIDDFARGFTGSKQLFDFVDVGMGKDRADDKISEIFKLHLYDCHCRHILFGCSHDNGYARLLEDVADPMNFERITLLEGVPFERELASLKVKYSTIKFDDLFRAAKIVQYPQHPQSHVASAAQVNSQNSFPAFPPGLPRTPQTSFNQAPLSWSATVSNRVENSSPPVPVTLTTAPNSIPRNRNGDRIDSPIQTKYDPSEYQRVKSIKMCTNHYLRGDCAFQELCSYVHDYKPSKAELINLKYVARQTPCNYGTSCDDIKCIYGHRCPFSEEGKKSCPKYAESCRFPKEMHGIDTSIVKTVRVGGK